MGHGIGGWMDRGSQPRDAVPAEAGKGRDGSPLDPPGGTQPWNMLILAKRPVQTGAFWGCKIIKVCFRATEFVDSVTAASGHSYKPKYL